MNRIEKLIGELCPDGVEWKELGEVVEILDYLRKPISKDKREFGVYPYYGANGVLEYVKDYIFDGTFLLFGEDGSVINKDGSPVLNWATGKIWVNNHAHVLSENKDVALLRYLYYYLCTIDVSPIVRGVPPKINQQNLRAIAIPIPPLSIQQEIVSILDTFTALDAALQAELEARRKQYEHYRDQLLSFEGKEVEWKTLGGICKYIVSGGTPSTNRRDYYGGDIPWLRTQEVDWNNINDTGVKITELGLSSSTAKWIKPNCVIVAMYGATAAKVAVNKIPLTTNQACCNLEINEEVANYRFVFHWICKEYENLKSLGEGVQSNINSQKIKNFPIPIPPLPIQHRIVSILDKFDALVNTELPAEIAARRKQYEYYREKLLTFKPLKS